MHTPPILMVGGWYDLHVNGQIRDFSKLHSAGRHVRLVIGPWHHESMGITGYILREGFAWFAKCGETDTHYASQPDGLRVYIMGRGKWMDLSEWPADKSQTFYLHGDATLSAIAAESESPRKYIYDPMQPTPSVGGNVTIVGKTAGIKIQTERENRSDVICYTTQTLNDPLCIIGNPEVRLWVRTDAESADFFVRICDVDLSGKSTNVVDGMSRAVFISYSKPQYDTTAEVVIKMNPTAYEFAAGHRVRLQVSGGAHPMYIRNLGVAASNELKAVDSRQIKIEIYNDAKHLSEVQMPIF